MEIKYNLPKKNIFELGYSRLDDLIKIVKKTTKTKNETFGNHHQFNFLAYLKVLYHSKIVDLVFLIPTINMSAPENIIIHNS